MEDAPLSCRGDDAGPRRPGLRIVISWVPWLAFAVAVTAMGLWWTQRPWPMRLAACSLLVAWSGVSVWAARRSGHEARFRTLLIWSGAVVVALGLQGAVAGLSAVPVVLSAWLAAAGALLIAIAAMGSPLARAKALAAAFSTVLALAALEAGARALGIGETAREHDSLEIARRFNNLTPPGSAFVNRPKSLDEFPPATIEINSIGIRGPEIPTGHLDLLLLGDSFIEARQLPWEDTLGPRLQATLRARSSSARIVSHGMRGWSPLLEWNWYLKIGRRFRAERVLLFFFWNDLWSAGTEAQTFRAVFDGEGRPDHFDVLLDAPSLWYRHVRTVRLIEEVARLVHARAVKWPSPSAPMGSFVGGSGRLDDEDAKRMARAAAVDAPLTASDVATILTESSSALDARLQGVAKSGFWPAMRPTELWTDEQRAAAAETEHELARFARDVGSDGGRLVIVYVPNPYQVGRNECTVGRYLDRLDGSVMLPADSGVQAWLRSVTGKHGIEFLDPTAAMRKQSPEDIAAVSSRLYLRADCHWSPSGHQFMADWLAEWFLSGPLRVR